MDNIQVKTHVEAAVVIFALTFVSSFLGTPSGLAFIAAHPYVKDIAAAALTAYTAARVYLGAKPQQPEGPAPKEN